MRLLLCSRRCPYFGETTRAQASPINRRLACPALVGVCEGARFLKTQEPRDVSDRKASVTQIALSKIGPHFIEHLGKGNAFRRKPPRQCPRTDAQVLSDLADARLAVRQERQDRVLYGGPDGVLAARPPGQSRFPVDTC